MNLAQARQLIKETFTQPFDRDRFGKFAANLLNHVDGEKKGAMAVPDAFAAHVKSCQRLAGYADPGGELLDVLIVNVSEDYKIERTRTALRDFVAHKLKRGDNYKEAALVAFVPPDARRWRLSYVRMQYETVRDPKTGVIKPEERPTPARRFSYLVGEGESCHTAQTRFFDLLQDTATDPTLAQIEEAFSVEAVTKEFFSKYAKLFGDINAALDKLVAKDKTLRDEFKAKGVNTVDFAKKLMGQIVFLYFLQKKGWLGVEKGKDWGTGPRDFLRRIVEAASPTLNIFNDILEPLFYDTLATDRGHDAWCSRFKCRIPFLNGGLFEPLADYDWRKTDVILPNRLFTNDDPVEEGITGTGVLDVFDRYNFTVNEAEPLEKEVAIDPEMLGKVFENLIEENRRKGLGAFYTPREIVHYMCQESLINYLETAVNAVPRADIETFVRLGEQISHYEAVDADYKIKMPKSIQKSAKALDDALRTITVCDPAVGSGAFPVGMMTEIVRARAALTPYFNDIGERTPYHFKRHAIQNCLYGVDIDSSAVDIAKLRLWLSLVVDEEDVKQVKPLPNLDYKIVVGNSLIELLSSAGLHASTDAVRTDLVNRLKSAKDQMFDLTSSDDKKEKRDEIDRLFRDLFEHDRKKEIEGIRQRLANIRAQGDLFEGSSRKEQIVIHDLECRIEEVGDIRIPKPSEHFEWGISFSEVFQKKRGFDVVIANPPYVRVQELPHDTIDAYKRRWATAWKRLDVSTLFMELAASICSPGGNTVFISSNQFLVTEYGRKTREFFLSSAGFTAMVDFGDLPVFDNTLTYVSIFFFRARSTQRFNYTRVQKLPFVLGDLTWETIAQKSLNGDTWVLGGDAETHLIAKLVSENPRLDSYAKCWAGLFTGLDSVLLFDKGDARLAELETAMLMPVLRAQSCDRYCLAKPTKYTVYPYIERLNRTVLLPEADLKRNYPRTYDYLKKHKTRLADRRDSRTTLGEKGMWYGLVRFGKRSVFGREKIVSPGEVRANKFALDKTGSAFSCARVFAITSESPKLPLLYLLGVLNSRLIEFYLHRTAPLKQGGYYSYNASVLDAVPLRVPTTRALAGVEDLVTSILAAKKADPSADTTALEREIDQIVYRLYGLLPEEIAQIEGALANTRRADDGESEAVGAEDGET